MSTSRQLSYHDYLGRGMVKRPIHRISGLLSTPELDELAEECIITILNRGEIQVRLLATPNDLLDLAYGHFLAEGRGYVLSAYVNGQEVTVEGDTQKRPSEDLLTAACGACTTGEIIVPRGQIQSDVTFHQDLMSIFTKMKSEQTLFQKTGGTHAAALFDMEGNLLVLREDVGRHNTVDKVIGAAHRKSIEMSVLALSGRIGWEIVAKCVRVGIPIIIAVGAISSAAEALARQTGITLVGFAASKNPAVIGDLYRIIDKC